jgi:hypothetical protein
MAITGTTNLLHFHLNELFKKWFLIWNYFVWQFMWLLLKNGQFFQIIWSLWFQTKISYYTNRLLIVSHPITDCQLMLVPNQPPFRSSLLCCSMNDCCIKFLQYKPQNQGDQIGRFFANWATFGRSLWFLKENELAQRFFLHFHLSKKFQGMVCS